MLNYRLGSVSPNIEDPQSSQRIPQAQSSDLQWFHTERSGVDWGGTRRVAPEVGGAQPGHHARSVVWWLDVAGRDPLWRGDKNQSLEPLAISGDNASQFVLN